MQYKVKLPKDYDMGIIRKRVQDNSHKTDGFLGLKFKAYLITEAEQKGNLYNSYAPLYLWNEPKGMNHFIFDGYFDNILDSFGWQQINIGVPLTLNLKSDFHKSNYVVEHSGMIKETSSLVNTPLYSFAERIEDSNNLVGTLLFYNPDKWGYSHFSFFRDRPEMDLSEPLTFYEILHISES